jgi:hypothetical protein
MVREFAVLSFVNLDCRFYGITRIRMTMGQDPQELATANALLSNDDDNDADLRYLHSLLRDQQHVTALSA